MLLRAYIGFSVACFLILQVISWAVACELRERYGTSKTKKRSFSKKFLGWLYTVVVCATPIWHIFMILIMIFKYHDVIECTIEKTVDELDIEGDSNA
jgi:hypothetical protein